MVLSIIICTYNRVKFLEKCINSILNQINDYPEIEVVIIDNNSQDNTRKFIEHERVIYLPTTISRNTKSRFINTCNFMIHARKDGETFG